MLSWKKRGKIARTDADCYPCTVMDVTPAEAKLDLLERLLEDGMVQVMLDARGHGVDVPPHLRNDYQLRLNLSYRFNNHMDIDRDGVEATLTFKGQPYTCRLPWSCLYMMVSTTRNEPPYIFPSDMPHELMHLANQLSEEGDANRAPAPAQSDRPALSVVHSAPDTESTEGIERSELNETEESEQPNPPKGRSHLRVVK